jgi:hypothetical protein
MDLGEYKQFTNGPEAESPEADRRSRRAPVLLVAEIDFARCRRSVKVRNISDTGALIEGDHLPSEGSTGTFSRNELSIGFTVVWVHGRYAGVAFVRQLNREEVLRHVPQSKQAARYTPPFKRPGFACRPLTAYERKNLERWMTTAPVASLGE